MSLAFLLMVQSVAPVTLPTSPGFDLSHISPRPAATLTALDRCDSNNDEIVVCGNRRERYRLPGPIERTDADDRAPGEVPSGMAALTPAKPCGIFAGERSCSKAEAMRYGYGGGRDPITVLTTLAKKVADPDAD